MKVLFATMQFGRGYGQGTERYIMMLADGLRRRGHEVVVLAGDPERRGPQLALGEEVEPDPRVLFLPTRSRLCIQGVPPSRLLPVLRHERPDVVHLVNPGHIGVGLVPAARSAGCPVVVTVVDYWWLCPKQTLLHRTGCICDADGSWLECVGCLGAADRRLWMRRLAGLPVVREVLIPALYFGRALLSGVGPAELARWVRRQATLTGTLNSADALIFLSDGARQRIAPRLNHTRHYSISVGMEQRWFDAGGAEPFDTSPRDPTQLTVGFVGALAEHKGPHLLLQAVAQLGWTGARIRLVGGSADDAYLGRLRALADGLNAEFVGRVPTTDMPAVLRELDVLVVPSIWPENLPQTVLEAQAVGTPVLASRVDGIAEVVSDPTMLFDVNSAASLARCLEDWAKAPRRPSPAKPVSTVDEMVERTIRVYQSLRQTN